MRSTLRRKAEEHPEGSSDGALLPRPGRAAYKAFISYSHAVDRSVASALRNGLHRLARPMLKLRAMRVFVDESSLSANPELWSTIVRALEGAEYLVLLASPEAANSNWVQQEVAWWHEHKPPGTFVLALTGGEIRWDRQAGDFDWEATTALPVGLKGVFAEEPLYIDMRWARACERLSLSDPQFRDDVADIAAFVHARDKDELLGEDLRQHRRIVGLSVGAILSLTALLLTAVGLGLEARSQRDVARAQARLALSRQLAAQAAVERPNRLDRSLLLSIEAVRTMPTEEAHAGLLAGLATNPQLVSSRPLPEPPGTSPRFDGVRNRWAWGTSTGVVLWDVETATASTLPGLADVDQVAISPKGIIAASDKETTHLWDPDRLQPVGPPLPAAGLLTFSADGTAVAVMGPEAVTFWDVATGQPRRETVTPPGYTGGGYDGGGCGKAVAASPDLGRIVFATGEYCDQLVVWDVQGQRESMRGAVEDNAAITELLFSPTSPTLMSIITWGGGRDKSVGLTLWRLEGGGKSDVRMEQGPRLESSGAAFSPAGSLVAVPASRARSSGFGSEGVIAIIGVDSAHLRGEPLSTGGALPTGVAFASEIDVATVTPSTVDRWEVGRTSRLTQPVPGRLPGLALSGDGERLAVNARPTDTGPPELIVWSVGDRRAVGSPVPGGNFVALSSDGTLVAVAEPAYGADYPHRLVVREVATGVPVGQAFGMATGAAFDNAGGTLAVEVVDGSIALWDVDRQEQTGFLSPRTALHPREGSSARARETWLEFGADDKTLFVGDQDGVIRKWALGRKPALELELDTGLRERDTVSDMDFTPDGRYALISGNLYDESDGFSGLWLWDVRRRERVLTFEQQVFTAAFSPDGRTFVTADDESVLLWEVGDHRPLAAPIHVSADLDRIGDLLMGANGLIVVGAVDGVSFSTTDVAAWEQAACAVFSTNFTEAEWAEVVGDASDYVKTCP